MYDLIPKQLLYYKNVYLKECETVCTACRAESGLVWLTTEETVFYPGGGGQLPDKGWINGKPLVEIKKNENRIWYAIEGGDSVEKNSNVKLELDWGWRYYNMQQHSGQHLLSAVLNKRELKTVSVHLGEAYTLIEVDGGFPDEQQLDAIEKEANRLIRMAIPLKLHWANKENINRFPLRRPAGNWDNLRVVEIENLDFAACAGTHVNNTAEIGTIKMAGAEKIRGHARIKVYIGARADSLFHHLQKEAVSLKIQLNCELGQFAERVGALQNELDNIKRKNDVYRGAFIDDQCRSLLENNRSGLIMHRYDELEIKEVEDIARRMAKQYKRICFLQNGSRYYLTAPESSRFETAAFLKNKGKKLGLRGGGPPGFAQGVIEKNNDREIHDILIKEFEKTTKELYERN